jgi:hypothetical protein
LGKEMEKRDLISPLGTHDQKWTREEKK